MAVRNTRWMAALATGAACAALTACSPPAPQETAPPPPPPPEAPPPPLAGGPPPVTRGNLAPLVVTMAPIPNPGDLSAAERRRIYGRHYAGHRVERIYGAKAIHKAGPVHVAAPIRVAPAAPVVAQAPAPVVAPVAAPPAPAAKPPTKLLQLQTAVGQIVAQGANLAVSPDIAQGKSGGVSLTLPANLFDILRDQAAQFGFKRAARKANISATLTGDGYSVTPNGAQIQSLKPGQAAQFDWQVTPGQSANGPLHAKVDASLTGQGAPKLLSLASVQSAVVQAQVQAQQTVSGLHLPSLSHFLAKLFGQKSDTTTDTSTAPAAPAAAPAPAPADTTSGLQSPLRDRTLPIVGHVTVRAQIAAFLAFLAVLILLLIQRNMAEQRRGAERRRFRSMNAAYQPMDMDAEPEHTTVHSEPDGHPEPEPA